MTSKANVLAAAVHEIDRYLSRDMFRHAYDPQQITRILLVRNAMEDLREELDTPLEEA